MTDADVLSPKDAAAFLKVGRTTLSRLIEQEGLPCVVLAVGPNGNRMIRFRRADLERWLESRSVVTPQAQQHPWQKFRRAPGTAREA